MPEEADNVEFVEDGEDPRNNLDLWTRGNREKMTKNPKIITILFFLDSLQLCVQLRESQGGRRNGFPDGRSRIGGRRKRGTRGKY